MFFCQLKQSATFDAVAKILLKCRKKNGFCWLCFLSIFDVWINVRNLHIPMLDEEGNTSTYEVGQKIKPAFWHLNVVLNGG
ncbi:MAG: hypothetical protein ACI85O_003360 [Saprospiraceae bacterium]|jgi:hypothetical protein